MPQDRGNGLILSLADILNGSQVNTDVVLQSLELLCKGMSFDCGLVYETDFLEQFCLKEHYMSREITLRRQFSAGSLTSKQRLDLAHRSIFCIEEDGPLNDTERQLLKEFGATALVLAPILDAQWQAYGLVILLNAGDEKLPSASHQQILKITLSMLARYVGVRMYQSKLIQARTALENILDNTGIDIYVNDFCNHDILYVNESMARPYGGKSQFVGKKCWQVLFPGQNGPCEFCPQKKLVDQNGMPTMVYSWDYQRSFDGSWFRVFSAVFRWVDGRLAHVVSSADITDNKHNEALIEYMANYDQLTGLPNRRMLVKECEQRIVHATKEEKGYLLFFDIDGFKGINDNFGHDTGDEFLVQLGQFFSGVPMLKDVVYRNGGDEFVAILGGESVTKDHVVSLGSFIHQRFQKPWCLKKGDVFCNTSIGVACYPEDGITVEALLQKADMAMYQAKRNGGGGLCFAHQLEELSTKGR